MYRPHGNLENLLSPVSLKELARAWLKEDTPSFDWGGYVVGTKPHTSLLLCKSPGVLAGRPFFDAVFRELDCTVEWVYPERSELVPVCTVARVRGRVRDLLQGERVALNCLSRVSAVATGARALDKVAREAGWHGEVAGTRKTTPGFRLPEKYGLLIGGVSTHRLDLSSMIMLKDNHIWTAGSITQAVKDAKRVGGFALKIEVECRSLAEATEATKAGADVIMLDNFQPQAAKDTARELRSQFSHVVIEASGAINRDTIRDYMSPDIDVISLSRTTQGYGVVDFSLKVEKEGRDPANPPVMGTA